MSRTFARNLLLLVLCVGICFTACARQERGEETLPAATEEPSATPSLGLTLLPTYGSGGAVGGESPEGNYQLDGYGDGTADIIYFDYATASCIRLSSDPNLGHDPASTAYIPDVSGGVRCAVSGQNLYVVKSGSPYSQGQNRAALYYRMDLNGANRTCTQLDSNLVIDISLPMAGDGVGNLYFIGRLVDTETLTVNTALLKVGPQISGYETVAQWEGESVALAGTYQEGFVLDDRTLENSGLVHRFFTLDLETGQEIPFTLDTADISSYTIQDGILYYTLDQDGAIYSYDISQGTSLQELAVTLPQGGQPSRAGITGMVRDDHLLLLLEDPEGGERVQGGLDLETGIFFPVTLGFGEGEDWTYASICGEGESWFMIRAGKETRIRQEYGTGETPYQLESEVPVYGVISKEDYWNDQPNYEIFQRYE